MPRRSVKISPLDQTVEVEEGRTILEGALRAGIWLPHACCHGLCGTCKVRVTSGDVDPGDASSFALMDFERDEGWTLACCARPQSDLEIEADVDDDPDAETHPLRDFDATVVGIEELTPDIRGIFLRVEGEGISFQAGQYVSVIVPGVPGPRPYSMANPPSQPSVVELHVRRVEGGAATTYLHGRLRVGDALRFQGPYGRFFVRKSAPNPLLFLAGGSGLSAVKAMILDLLEGEPERDVILVHGARTRRDLYDRELFERTAAEHAAFEYVPVLSETTADGWSGETGFVHEAVERFADRARGRRAYLCGPPPMIDACVTSLMRLRIFERDIFHEKFLTAAEGESGRRRSPLFRRV